MLADAVEWEHKHKQFFTQESKATVEKEEESEVTEGE